MFEEIVPYLNEEEDIIMTYSREDHWKNVANYDEDRCNIHSLRWDVYTK